MEQLIIIKIGGSIIDDDANLNLFLKSFAALKANKILIHGGGKIATKIATDLGIVSNYNNGRRITDTATLDVVTMVYAGLINKKIIATLQGLGCNALGLTGADANLIPANKRPVQDIDFGFVGDLITDKINTHFLQQQIANKYTCVIAPITHNNNGQLLNTNADTVAQSIAVSLSKTFDVSLVYAFEKAGVLLNVNDDSSVIKQLTLNKYNTLKQTNPATNTAVIAAGMIPKLDNAFEAIQLGVKKVIIGNALDLNQLIKGTIGTTIIYE